MNMQNARGLVVENPASSKEITRAYFDSLLLEERLMDSAIPNTEMELYVFGCHFRLRFLSWLIKTSTAKRISACPL